MRGDRTETEWLYACGCGPEYVVLVDDGEAMYAYLHCGEDERIVVAGWLYNFGETPETPQWTGRRASRSFPCKNAKPFVKADGFTVPTREDVDILWSIERPHVWAAIYVNGVLHGVIGSTDRVAWCKLARRPSPIAQVLNPDQWRSRFPASLPRYRLLDG